MLTRDGEWTRVFHMAKVTYNKDGTPRKKGSGRKKGSNSLVEIKFSQLTEAGFSSDDPVVVGRKWFDENFKKKDVDISSETVDTTRPAANAVQEKIAYKLTTFK